VVGFPDGLIVAKLVGVRKEAPLSILMEGIMEPESAIEKRTKLGGKTYEFADQANPRLPAQHWFDESVEGRLLFIILYTQACKWSQCLGCNLPSAMSSGHIPFQDIMKQIDFVFDYLVDSREKDRLRKIILSNNGSILDEDTFSTTALVYFVAKMNMACPKVRCLTIETRPEYADMEELEILARVLREGERPTYLELAIGFEAFDERIRNDVFRKGLTLEGFEDFVTKVAKHKFRLKVYFMLKPIPDLEEAEAVEDIKRAMDYLNAISSRFDLSINMHLNPTYAAKGTPLAVAFAEGRFCPPKISSLVELVHYNIGKPLSLFIGVHDEGLSVPGGHCFHGVSPDVIGRFRDFNQTQDASGFKEALWQK